MTIPQSWNFYCLKRQLGFKRSIFQIKEDSPNQFNERIEGAAFQNLDAFIGCHRRLVARPFRSIRRV